LSTAEYREAALSVSQNGTGADMGSGAFLLLKVCLALSVPRACWAMVSKKLA